MAAHHQHFLLWDQTGGFARPDYFTPLQHDMNQKIVFVFVLALCASSSRAQFEKKRPPPARKVRRYSILILWYFEQLICRL